MKINKLISVNIDLKLSFYKTTDTLRKNIQYYEILKYTTWHIKKILIHHSIVFLILLSILISPLSVRQVLDSIPDKSVTRQCFLLAIV